MNLTSPLISRQDRRLRWLAPLFAAAIVCGCSQREDPEVAISWLAPQTHAAKPADCAMPMLKQMPNTDYQQIAIIEVVDDYNADEAEVEGLARRKACETGAEAIVILESKQQKAGNEYTAPGSSLQGHSNDRAPDIGEAGHKGRILNAVAIVYETEKGGKSRKSASNGD